jgi:glycosyltransferase domain-containing protein
MNKSNLSKKCGIVIPTFNRPGRLKRILSYYNECGKDCSIIIGDSSVDKIKKQNKKTVSSFSDMNILYLDDYIPEHHDFDLVTRKNVDVMDQVKEKYCITCADDDFVLPVGLSRCIDFLEKNPDYANALGDYFSFRITDDGNGQKKIFWKFRTFKSIDQENATDRMFTFVSDIYNYPCPTMGVYRTSLYRLLLRETLKYTEDGRFWEALIYPLSLTYGKMKHIEAEVFHVAREMDLSSVGNVMDRFSDFVTEGTFDKKYYMAQEGLAIHLVKNSDVDIEEARVIVDEIYMEFFKHAEGQQLIPRINRILKNIHLPQSIEEAVRVPFRKLRYKKITSKNRLAGFRTNDPPEKYLEEFNRIKKFSVKYIS